MKSAIVIFSFNRPEILKQLLNKLSQQNNVDNFDIYLYQDNNYNNFSKKEYCSKSIINENIKYFQEIIPTGKVVLQSSNIGVGLNHFIGYEDMFIKHKYDNCIFLDDDVILDNLNCLNTLILMNNMTQSNKDVMGSELYTIPFIYKATKNKVLLMDTFKYHIDFKGFCCSKIKFNLIYNFYKDKVNAFFKGIDYKERWKVRDKVEKISYENKIKNFFLTENNSKNKFYSQDWVRDTCFRHFGMNRKAILNANIAKNIGDIGVHSDKKLFILEGFDNIRTYEGEINIDGAIYINDSSILINNNPSFEKFSLTYKSEETKLFLMKKYRYRFS